MTKSLDPRGRKAQNVSFVSHREALLQRAATAARTGAWEWDVADHRVAWTESLERVLDLSSIEFDGSAECLAQLIHPSDRSRLQRGFQNTLACGEPFEADLRTVRQNGDALWVHFKLELVREDDDRTVLCGTAVDVQARKQADVALQESEQRFAALFQTSPLSVTLSSDTGRLIAVNDTFIKLTGYQREEALGRTTIELGIWPSTADREAAFASMREPGGLRNRNVHLRARNGEERTGFLSAERVSINGQPHLLTSFEDTTLRDRAEAALRESEQRLRLALRAASAGVWQMDLASGDIFWSDEFRELYGYDVAVSPGRETWATHLHPDDRDRMLNDLRTRLKPGTNEYRREFRILHPTRGLRWILALGQIERNEQGRALRMRGISIDITRIKEVEQELREADRRKNDFLAVLSHELRNPLAPLRNGIEILRLTQGSGELAERARIMMARQLEQMVRLIDDLLEVSRISRGKIELRREPIDLTLALQHALEVSKPLIDAANHDLTIDISPGPLMVNADLTRLAQVFGNLLNNAAKYTNPGGRIRLSVARSNDELSVSVQDNGIGIPPEMLPKVFEMFAQVDNSHQRTQGGLGIGLSIAKRLVEMHDGTLEARSAGLGQGCEFIVRLPVHAPAATTSNDAPRPLASKQRATRSLRILIADDNQDAAASLALVLEMHHHVVRVAHDGVEAVQIAAAFAPEVAILDIGMPRLDGYETCKRLRALPCGPSMLIVALTGWGQADDKRRSQQAGFHRHFVKPMDAGSLEEWLSAQGALR